MRPIRIYDANEVSRMIGFPGRVVTGTTSTDEVKTKTEENNVDEEDRNNDILELRQLWKNFAHAKSLKLAAEFERVYEEKLDEFSKKYGIDKKDIDIYESTK